MTPEFIGMIQPRRQSEIHPPGELLFDHDYIRDSARAHDEGGFDRMLVGYHSDAPDGFLVAAHALASTKRVGVLLAHRPGFVAPTVAARKFATLDHLGKGRAAIHVISGGDDADQRRDGDYLDKDARYDRTDEYLDVLKKVWTAEGPVDHQGLHYRFEKASPAMRSWQRPHIPIYFGGASEAALKVAAKHADVYALWGETYAQVREITGRVRAAAAAQGRSIRCSLSFRPILAETEERAWAKARDILDTIVALRKKAGLAVKEPANEGSRRLLAAAAQGEVLDKRLWTGVAAATGARGNTTALVGTPEQVGEVLADYWDLGVSTFLIRGFDPLEDAVEYGRDLLPASRAQIAARGAKAAAE
jgi:alkanesulfonate monooxygenase